MTVFYRRVTRSEAEQALRALGKTERAVHRKLRTLRLQGRVRRSASCIIAKYLQSCYPHSIISVGYDWAYFDRHLIRIPPPVKAVIEHFDAGKYPELTVPKKC